MESITYEELFEILRRERNSEELQLLNNGFYASLVTYLQGKQDILTDQSQDAGIFSSEKNSVGIQLENAKKIAKELVERRQKKIINLALDKARTGSDIIDTSPLLDVEQEFFHKASDLFSDYRTGVVGNMITLKIPEFNDVVSETVEVEATEAKELGEQSEAAVGAPEPVGASEEPSGPIMAGTTATAVVTVKFLQEVPKFLGKNAEIFGPFKEEETAKLSPEIADILIEKGRAKRVE